MGPEFFVVIRAAAVSHDGEKSGDDSAVHGALVIRIASIKPRGFGLCRAIIAQHAQCGEQLAAQLAGKLFLPGLWSPSQSPSHGACEVANEPMQARPLTRFEHPIEIVAGGQNDGSYVVIRFFFESPREVKIVLKSDEPTKGCRPNIAQPMGSVHPR